MVAHYSQAYFTDPKSFFARANSRSHPMDWSASRAALVRIVELARTHRFQVGLAIFPELMSLEDYPFTAIHAFVEETCREIGMPVHDLLPAFQGHKDHQLWVHPTDHHPNEIAHDLAAGSLEQFIRTLIPSTSTASGKAQSP